MRRLGALIWVLAAGCAAGPPTLEGPESASAPAPRSDAAPGRGTLTLVNDTQEVVYRVRFRGRAQTYWGPDRLVDDEVIAAGARRSWPLEAGAYQVRVELRDGSVLAGEQAYLVRRGREAICELVVEGERGSQVGTLTLINACPFAIARVYFSPTSEMSLGDDRLGQGVVLAPRGRRSWPLLPGRYHVKVVFQDETSLEQVVVVAAEEERMFQVETP